MLLEQIVDQNKAVLEAVGDIQRKVAHLPTRDEFDELRRDVRDSKELATVTKSEVTAHSSQLAELDSRSSAIEAA